MHKDQILNILKKVADRLFSTSAAGLYIILFAISIGLATFIENDFGTSAAQKVIYKTRWFELLLAMFCISLVFNIFRFRMVQQRKWATFTFHASMIIILIGAGVTRYIGSEGMMHIREGSVANSFLSRDTYLNFEATRDGKKYAFSEPALFASLGNNKLSKSYSIGGQQIDVEVVDFMPNPAEVMVDDKEGLPVLKIVIGGANGREEYYLKQGDRVKIRGTLFNFRDVLDPAAFNIRYVDNELIAQSPAESYSIMKMATQERDSLLAGEQKPLLFRSLYSNNNQSFVFGDFSPAARVEVQSSARKMESNSTGGVRMRVSSGGQEESFTLFGNQGVEGRPRTVQLGDMQFAVSYGSKRITLPFAIKLNKFIMEKYPGTNSASSYESMVTLLDPRDGLAEEKRIYMNNILNYGGYRFFQSSFDQDELGTYLSVNHDAPGTLITYLGYGLLTLGLILTFFSKRSRFQELKRNISRMREARKTAAAILIGLFFALPGAMQAYSPIPGDLPEVDPEHAKRFGEVVMQDHKGRFKPMDTYTNEILRKLSRKEEIYGLNAEQILLAMATKPADWYQVPLIKSGHHEDIQAVLGTDEELVAYSDFFDTKGEYKLRDYVRAAYNKPQRDRGVYEKELLKIDERVNICSMIFSGRFMKVFPVPGDQNNTWISPAESGLMHGGGSGNSFMEQFYGAYIPTLDHAMHDGNWDLANRLLEELQEYQHTHGGEVMPSDGKVRAELLLNKLDVFSRLGKVYGLLGLAFLGLLFTSVFKPGLNLKWPSRVAFGIFGLAFLFHLLGLALRWYVSGRAPWSNGYESMIYIAFTTVLAGLIFSRKSLGGMAATNVLAATILMVAGLSWLDPEITPLVPVLKSYWLTIHVSLEAGSYGFLMLGALIGVLNLIFMIFGNEKNGKRVYRIVREMSYISEMTLIGGLVMISIGTYLGGVWANESWGRYWGWDAKETWALVTILVYAFILHMRFIPGFRGLYAFNVSTLFGWASVIMTYFGVNYYLSGLHSYAAGDPMPIPPPIFYAVIILTIISLLALWRHKVYLKKTKGS